MDRHLFLAAGTSAVLTPHALSAEVTIPDPPDLRDADGYLSIRHTASFQGSPRAVRQALQTEGGGVLAFAETTPAIPQVVGAEPLRGAFPDVGAIRRLRFADGNTVVERSLRNDDTAFIYQVWAFTAANAWALDHIRGQFVYEPVSPNRTNVTWSYSIAPSTAIARPFISRFLNRDFRPFLVSGLDGAAAAFNSGG